MKLWTRITLGVAIVTLLILGGCLYYFSSQQATNTLSSMEENGLDMLDLFMVNISSINNLSSIDTDNSTSINSAVQYAFMTQTRSLKRELTYYSLQTEMSFYDNNCPYDLSELLSLSDHQIRTWTTRKIDDEYLFVACKRLTLFNQTFVIYIARNVTSVYAELSALKQTAEILLLVGMVLLLILLPLLINRALHPLKKLSQTAQQIAAGAYSLRTQVTSTDEVGDMGNQFNLMADALEKKIDELSELAENRTLMLAALTHELKTPLTSIIGYADTYLHVPLEDKQKEFCIEQIFDAGRRTERLSQKLMQIISLEETCGAELKALDASELVETVQTSTEHSLSAKKQTLVIDNSITRLYGDADLLVCLISNLIENASRASDENTIVELRLCETDTETQISVVDHGRGIPAEQLKRITEPFYRVDKARDRKSGGAGLGLALCKTIANAHQGTLTMTSELHVGSCMTLLLPK